MGATLGKKPADQVVSGQQLANGTVSTNKIQDLAITGAKVADGAISAAKMASGAALANLGFTPVDVTNPSLGAASNAWHYIVNTKLNGGPGTFRKAKQFTGNTSQQVFKMRTNYGWDSYIVRIRLHEYGHVGGSYREILLTGQQGSNGFLTAQSYSVGVNNVQMIGGTSSYSITSTFNGGAVDVGWFDTVMTVTPEVYGDIVVDVEFWAISETSSSPSKGQIQFI
jgi:hypothetical protein